MSNDAPTKAPAADAVEALRALLSTDLRTAMKAGDKQVIGTLRCLLGVLDNAGAQDPKAFGHVTEVPRRTLTQNELQTLMQAEVTSRIAAVTEYERVGRRDDAKRLRAELILVEKYMGLRDIGGQCVRSPEK
jgi:uncharacterized protein YqeY